MIEAVRFPYLGADPTQTRGSLMPLLPRTLSHGRQQVSAFGLVDTGAAANVLPYSPGTQLGFAWEQQRVNVTLSGSLGRVPGHGIIVEAVIAYYSPVRLAFAWVQTDDVRLLLGQANFFVEFDACFFRSRSEFEIKPKGQFSI